MTAIAPVLGPGTRLGAYEIVMLLGTGGMGAVYKARDTRLGRPVALKLLSSTAIPNAEARSILEREARAISRLNHPHICTLYDIGHHEGFDYLVMEFIAGETLREQLERERLPPEDVLRYGTQIAEAMAEAHRGGLLHGDLKPGNIMVSPNGVKVLDFGLARPIDRETESGDRIAAPSREGAAGTLPYMAPEQLESQPGDLRSDIFSYGAVLFEMFSGRRPFTGATEAALIASILRCDLPPFPATGPGAQVLRNVIRRCLVKDPGKRWQRIDEVVDLLTAVRAPGRTRAVSRSAIHHRTGVRAIRRVVVLPFENRSPDTLEDYAAEGLTDALTTALSNIRQLRVISRTSALRVRDQALNLNAVAQMFGVSGVIRGIVSGSAERIHAQVELVETGTEAVLWSGTYDCPLNNILGAQHDVALTMAMTLRLTLTPEQKRAPARGVVKGR